MVKRFKNILRLKIVLLSFIATVLVLVSFTVTSIPVSAQGMTGMGGVRSMKPTPNMSPLIRFLEVDNDSLFTPLDVTLDIAGVIIMLIAIFIISKSIREYGKSTVGVAILYFLAATLILGAIRIIFILDDDNILNVTDVAEMTAWHTLYYYAVVLFYIAGLTFAKLVSTLKGKSSYPRALIMLIFSILLAGLILFFYSQTFVQNFLVKYEQPLPFYTFGWWHIIAVILSTSIALYLNFVKNKFKGYSEVIGSIIFAIILLACIHTWELLNESWRVIVVSDNFGEFFERILWVPVFIFILRSYIKLRRISLKESNAALVSTDSTGVNPISPQSPDNQPTQVSQIQQPTIIGQVPLPAVQTPSQQVPAQQASDSGTPPSASVSTVIETPQTGSEDTDPQKI